MKIELRKQIAQKINKRDDLTIQFKYADSKKIHYINGVVAKVFATTDQHYLSHSIINILREVITNALKANAKRSYFTDRNLNIDEAEDYKLGMSGYKKDVVSDLDKFKAFLQQSPLTVNLIIKHLNDSTHIIVKNGAIIRPEELERIKMRMEQSLGFNSILEAYEEFGDHTEGAGLGIALTIITLKTMGIDPKNFTIKATDSGTVVSLFVPHQIKNSLASQVALKELLSQHDYLPESPDMTESLFHYLESNDIGKLISLIKKSPAFTYNILKIANSSSLYSQAKTWSVEDALAKIDLTNIYSILRSKIEILEEERNYAHYDTLRDHCSKVGRYASYIASKYFDKDVAERAYLCGLLHDIGTTLLFSVDQLTVEKIAQHVKDRSIQTATFIEEIKIGISHTHIGGVLAKTAKLPNFIYETCAHHHCPSSSDEKSQEFICVYLANMITDIDRKDLNHFEVDELILDSLGLLEGDSFNHLLDELRQL